MDLLTALRNPIPAGTRSDFDDDVDYSAVISKRKEMTRIVEGATDLQVNRPAPKNPGMVKTADWSPRDAGYAPAPVQDDVEADDAGMPSPAQIRFINSLTADLSDLDLEAWTAAVEYNKKMNLNRAWVRTRGGNASVWIDRLKAKVAELKAAAPKTRVAGVVSLPDLADGRYAVELDGELKFYHLETGKKGGDWEGFRFLKRKSSDDLFPIRNDVEKARIMQAILDMGTEQSSIQYAVTLRSCRRCHRDLTDQKNPYLAIGYGPECGGKM